MFTTWKVKDTLFPFVKYKLWKSHQVRDNIYAWSMWRSLLHMDFHVHRGIALLSWWCVCIFERQKVFTYLQFWFVFYVGINTSTTSDLKLFTAPCTLLPSIHCMEHWSTKTPSITQTLAFAIFYSKSLHQLEYTSQHNHGQKEEGNGVCSSW